MERGAAVLLVNAVGEGAGLGFGDVVAGAEDGAEVPDW